MAIAGKKTTISISPDFNPNDYKWCEIEATLNGKIGMVAVDHTVRSFFWEDMKMPSPPKRAKAGILDVKVCEERGFCLPPRLSRHFKPIFFMPKKVEITITDSKNKKKLISIVYQRGLFASDGAFKACMDAIEAALREAFAKRSQTEAEEKPMGNPSPSPITEQKVTDK